MSGSAPRVLIVGGGVAALEVLLALRVHAGPTLPIELLSAEAQFTYRPTSVAEPFGRGAARQFDLAEIVADQRATLRVGTLAEVDVGARRAITVEGEQLEWDVLVVAIGARAVEAMPGALTFRGPQDAGALASLLREVELGEVSRIAFALPAGVTWPLPLYELALLTSAHASANGRHVDLTVVTSEAAPLDVFGPEAADAVAGLLEQHRIALRAATRPVAVEDGALHVSGAGVVPADRVVSLPRLEGPALDGLPSDTQGFIRADQHGRVVGLEDVYAAGDAVSFPLKQGGLATQQADAVSEMIASRAGAPVTPRPFRAVVRGLLITGGEPLYLRAEPGAGRQPASAAVDDVSAPGPRVRRAESTAATSALWWPPSKIAGRYLAPYLATARPIPLGSSPLRDRAAAVHDEDPEERAAAVELTLLMADHDARFGDYDLAVHALESAAVLNGGTLPPDYETKRAWWGKGQPVPGVHT